MSNSSSLKASIRESVEYQRKFRWRGDGVPEAMIRLSRQSGMDATDMHVFEAVGRGAGASSCVARSCQECFMQPKLIVTLERLSDAAFMAKADLRREPVRGSVGPLPAPQGFKLLHGVRSGSEACWTEPAGIIVV